MDDDVISAHLELQAGVITRDQVRAAGGGDNDIERKLRRREWARVHPGVYLNHTGEPTRTQAEWAAVLYYAPAALTGRSALAHFGITTGRGQEGRPVEVAVDQARRVQPRPGVTVTRVTRLADNRLANLSPPRMRVEHAVLEVAGHSNDEAGAVAVLSDAVRSRRTTAARLAEALRLRTRLPRRGFLMQVLDDVGEGVHSALEWIYVRRVERAHGLPPAQRQAPALQGNRKAYRDVEYAGFATVVELDGRLGHDHADERWEDLERDVDAAVTGRQTIRVGWRQCLQACRLAGAVAVILQARGWDGTPRACGPECQLDQRSPTGSRRRPGSFVEGA